MLHLQKCRNERSVFPVESALENCSARCQRTLSWISSPAYRLSARPGPAPGRSVGTVLSFLPPAFVADNSNDGSKSKLVNELQKHCQEAPECATSFGEAFLKSHPNLRIERGRRQSSRESR